MATEDAAHNSDFGSRPSTFGFQLAGRLRQRATRQKTQPKKTAPQPFTPAV
jgi:hypothetical protein